MPLEACVICCDEKLPEFLEGWPEYRCCRDYDACNRRAWRRLGVVEYEKQPGRGGVEGKRLLAECLRALAAYRRSLAEASAATASEETPVRADVEPDVLQLVLELGDAA